MNLSPPLESSPTVIVHVAAALTALLVGLAQFVVRKGIVAHRVLGWVWVCSMPPAGIRSLNTRRK